jgi:hypothetical protein
VVATLTDSEGRPLGDGNDAIDIFADFQATAGGYNDLEWESNEGEIAVGGVIEVGILEPAGGTVAKKYTYSIVVQVADQGPVTDLDCDTTSADEAATGTSEVDAILTDDTDCVSKSFGARHASKRSRSRRRIPSRAMISAAMTAACSGLPVGVCVCSPAT